MCGCWSIPCTTQTVVPVAAIQRGADGSFVFVVKPDKTVTQRTVKTGVQDGDKIQILSGIKPGDTVVVDGADRLRDGADVEIPAGGKITAPSGGGADDAARAARRASRCRRCWPRPAARTSRSCARTRRSRARARRACACSRIATSLSADCSKAMSQMRRGGGGGGRRGGGGGGGGGRDRHP